MSTVNQFLSIFDLFLSFFFLFLSLSGQGHCVAQAGPGLFFFLNFFYYHIIVVLGVHCYT
jgi:hypothetical protein